MKEKQMICQKTIIAGPCALESREQLQICIRALKKLGVPIVRASLWKPRTKPGWEGLGKLGLSILLEETIPKGIIPATEILSEKHAEEVIRALENFDRNAEVFLWLGARNQNHIEQKKIASILADGPKGIRLMFKNQMWEDERHWMGIYEHIIESGFPKSRLLTCHRGFAPGKLPNLNGFRNLPDFDMAARVKKRCDIPLILDLSHIGGSPKNVCRVIEMAKKHIFDGIVVEVHNNPKRAKTDMQQQLSIEEFQNLLSEHPILTSKLRPAA